MSVPLMTASGSRLPRTSSLPPPLTFGLIRNRNDAAPCGSRSQISVRWPSRAASAPRLTAAEVFPTPPLIE